MFCGMISTRGVAAVVRRTRVAASFEIPAVWLRKASFGSSPSSPKGAVSLDGILENMEAGSGLFGHC